MADSKLREMNEILSYPQNRSKNSVSLLLEIVAQVGESASFHPVEELGLSNMKLFTCEVKVGRLLNCKGTGSNKKTAKANAAQQALDIIKSKVGVNRNLLGSSQVLPSHSLQTASPAQLLSNPAPGSSSPGSSSPNTESNPIGSLQELCVKNNWTPPSYVLVLDSGEAHSKTFIYKCKIGSWVAQGQGKSKKSAKRVTADNMLSMIRGSPSKNPSINSSTRNPHGNVHDNMQGPPSVTSLPQGQSLASSSYSSKPVLYMSSHLYDPLASDDDVDIDGDDEISFKHKVSHSVVDDSINEEFCSALKEKGSQWGFAVEYYDFCEKGYSGNYLCFVRLGTTPPTVCSGAGFTKPSAHEKAAQSALHYMNTVSF